MQFDEVKDIIPFEHLGQHGRNKQFMFGDVMDWCRDYFGEPKNPRLAYMLIGYWFVQNEPKNAVRY